MEVRESQEWLLEQGTSHLRESKLNLTTVGDMLTMIPTKYQVQAEKYRGYQTCENIIFTVSYAAYPITNLKILAKE